MKLPTPNPREDIYIYIYAFTRTPIDVCGYVCLIDYMYSSG